MKTSFATTHDHARFAHGDAPALISAAFACRCCLRAADLVIIRGRPGARRATSQCSHCESLTRVALTDDQAHQIWQLPRGRPFIHFAVDP